MTEMPWPGDPITAELRAVASPLLAGMKRCVSADQGGGGSEAKIDAATASFVAIFMASHFLDAGRKSLAHPALQPQNYCEMERFSVANRKMVALGWQGDPAAEWSVRYAFMAEDGSRLFQIEAPFKQLPPPLGEQLAKHKIRRYVQLTLSDDRRVSALATFDDWPSYKTAKALVRTALDKGIDPVIDVRNPPAQMLVNVNRQRTAEVR